MVRAHLAAGSPQATERPWIDENWTCEGEGRQRTREDVWDMKIFDVRDIILPERCAILPIWVALMRSAAVPVHLPVLCWHTKMHAYPWN